MTDPKKVETENEPEENPIIEKVENLVFIPAAWSMKWETLGKHMKLFGESMGYEWWVVRWENPYEGER